ncbi:hypothetical protein ACFX13_046754 [Malus domestica]
MNMVEEEGEMAGNAWRVLLAVYMLNIFNIYFKSPHCPRHGSRYPPATTPAAPQPKSPSPPLPPPALHGSSLCPSTSVGKSQLDHHAAATATHTLCA